MRPALKPARARRTSSVWGKEPIVVVGKEGKRSRSCWSCFRFAKGLMRRSIDALIAAVRSATAGSWMRVEERRRACSSRRACNVEATASSPSFKARASSATSSTFCWAKASQGRSSGSSAVS